MNYRSFIIGVMMALPFTGDCSPYDLDGPWPVIGQNRHNTGAAHQDFKIDTKKVSGLEQSWTFANLTETGVSATPTISDGKVFIANGSGHVYALDEKTGEVKWKQTLVASDRGNAPQSFNTSPTITKHRVFVAGDHMFALDKHTGEVLWDTPIYQDGLYLSDEPGNPMVAGKYVIIGVGFANEELVPPGGHYTGEYGRIMAFHQKTGEIAWILPLSNTNYGTGSTSFSMAGVDETRKLAFIGTGNNYEPPASPLEDSLLAINYETGELVWQYQFNNNDIWSGVYYSHDGMHDLDVGGHPNLFTVDKLDESQVGRGKKKGKNDYVGVSCKDGTYRIFNRDQHDPENVQPVVQIQLDPGSLIGGVIVTPVVHDGILYISSNAYVDSDGNRLSLDTLFTNGQANYFTDFSAALFQGSSKLWAIDLYRLIKLKAGSKTGPEAPPASSVIWTNTNPGFIYSPTGLSFVYGVLFFTTFQGQIKAVDAKTGKLLFNSTVFPINPTTNALIVGGASIDGKRIFVPFGVENSTPYGGVVSYGLPERWIK